MDTIFENTCIDSQEEYDQMFSWLMPKYGSVIGIISIVFGVISILMAILLFEWLRVVAGIFLVFTGSYLLKFGSIKSKGLFKKKVETYDGVLPPKHYQFYEDRMRVFDVDSDTTMEYRRFKRIGFLKDCVAIMIDPADSVYLISNNGFTKGTFEEFKRFLREKCPSAKFSD